MKEHGERKHSKFSASGAERWFNCQGSVLLSEGLPDKDTIWSKEGTRAHEVLEEILLAAIPSQSWAVAGNFRTAPGTPREMISYGTSAANFILGLWGDTPYSDILVETRIHLTFIHKEMFGTFDGAVLDYFGTLHVFDYKYGAGHAVGPKGNLQMIFYGLGLAYLYNWNFKKVRLYIIQPRIKGYNGPIFWEISIMELRAYEEIFKRAVDKVEKFPDSYTEGPWCHWCKAKSRCPLKRKAKVQKAKELFGFTLQI